MSFREDSARPCLTSRPCGFCRSTPLECPCVGGTPRDWKRVRCPRIFISRWVRASNYAPFDCPSRGLRSPAFNFVAFQASFPGAAFPFHSFLSPARPPPLPLSFPPAFGWRVIALCVFIRLAACAALAIGAPPRGRRGKLGCVRRLRSLF